MATSSLERHDLEQDIEELRASIVSLESSRSRLRDIIPGDGTPQSGSVWSDITEIVTDFFEAAGEAISGAADGDDESQAEISGGVGKAARTAKGAVTTDWSKALADAFGRLRDRLISDPSADQSAALPVAELGGVLGELDFELARLNADLQRKLDRVSELDRAIDDIDVGPIAPVEPHHRDVVTDDQTVVIDHDDDDVDVIPVPVDIQPEVDPTPTVTPADDDTEVVIPVPVPDVDPVVDVTPVEPDVVAPDDNTTADDDTPAYETGKQTDIGELDGAVYDINEILAGGRTVADLRRYDVPAGVARDAGVSASAMIDGGYTIAELREAGYQAADLHGLASAADLCSAGYAAAELHGVFSVSECVDAFSPHELRDAGFTASDFHGLVSAADLRDVFSASELRGVYNVSELRSAGFDAADLSSGGVGWEELASAGFSLAELRGAGASEAALREIFPSAISDDDDDDGQ